MKKLVWLLTLFATSILAQTPDCVKTFQFTATGNTTSIDNRAVGCSVWFVAYESSTFSAISLVFQSAEGALTPGTYGNFSGTTVTGANPATNITSAYSTFTGYAGYLRMRLATATGSGTVTGILYGYKVGYASSGGSGGACGALGGDLSGTCAAAVVGKVNGVTYPASPSADQVAIITAALTATYKSIPACTGEPNALNYDTVTHAFSCQGITVTALNGVNYGASPATDTTPIITAANTATYKAVPACAGVGNALNYDVVTHAYSCRTITSTAQQHSIIFEINGGGSAIATGALGTFPTVAFACTINRIDVSADQSGSITVDIWKVAGAIPTGANKISASAPATLSTSQLSQSGSLSGWTTAVSSGDVFGGTIATVATVQKVTIQIWCS